MFNDNTTDRSIKDDYSGNREGSMTSEVIKWWKGLGKELQVDIESLQD